MGVGTQPQPGPGTFGNQLRCRTGHGSQQPIETAFARYEFDSPGAVFTNQFVVSLGDAKYLVGGLGPFPGYSLLALHGGENLAQRGAELPGLQQQSFGGLGIGLRQSQKLDTAFGGDHPRGFQENNETVPG